MDTLSGSINAPWESLEFYAAWMKDDDPDILAALKGPDLNLASRQGEWAPALLELARDVLLSDEAYVERVKRHYELFREKVEERGNGTAAREPKIARNAPCPCGSGRKYKKCCLPAANDPAGALRAAPGAAAGGEGPAGRGPGTRVLARAEIRIREEVDHIVRLAAECNVGVVRLEPLVFFSTRTGDAWLLEPDDGLALPLARDRDPLPVRIFETDERYEIEWTHDYSVAGEMFQVVDRATGKGTRIAGYPTEAFSSP